MDIVEQLRCTELHHVWDDLEGKMVGKMFSANPDGPEAADEIERLREDRERLQYALMKVCNSLDDNLPAIITKNIALAALGLPLRGMKEGE